MQKNVKQESQEILRQQRHGQMRLALSKIVLQMIPLGFGRIVVFILTLPLRQSRRAPLFLGKVFYSMTDVSGHCFRLKRFRRVT